MFREAPTADTERAPLPRNVPDQDVERDAVGTGAGSRARMILAVVIIAAFLDVVDFSVVQVALPTIQREFLAPLAESQWVTGVYGLTLAGFLMVSGRAGDVYSQKRIFVTGIVVFTLSSLSAGLAPSLLSLVVSYRSCRRASRPAPSPAACSPRPSGGAP